MNNHDSGERLEVECQECGQRFSVADQDVDLDDGEVECPACNSTDIDLA